MFPVLWIFVSKSNSGHSEYGLIAACREEEKGEEELVHEEIKIPSTKEAIEAFNVLSRFIENSKSYNDNQIELLKNVNDCILDISAEKLQQKNLFDFFKKV